MLRNLFSTLFKKNAPTTAASRENAPSPTSVSEPAPSRELAAQRYREHMKRIAQSQRDRMAACWDTEELSRGCSNYSGFTREAAVRRCVELRRKDLFPHVFERLNDWVPAVRDAARSGALALLPLLSKEEALALLPRVHALVQFKRSDHTAWIMRFEQVFIGKVPAALIANGIQSASLPLARSCFRVAWQYCLYEPAELIRRSLARLDDIVIAKMSLQACAALPQERQLPLYREALHSHFGAIRTFALRTLLTMGSEEERRGIAIDALWDERASMRSAAIYYLRTNGFDVRARYLATPLEASTPARIRRIVLTELGNVGMPADIGLLRSFVTVEGAGIRLAALTAWYKLEPSAKDAVARQALLDESSRVRKFASYLVVKQGAYLPDDFVRETMKQHGDGRRLM